MEAAEGCHTRVLLPGLCASQLRAAVGRGELVVCSWVEAVGSGAQQGGVGEAWRPRSPSTAPAPLCFTVCCLFSLSPFSIARLHCSCVSVCRWTDGCLHCAGISLC